MLLHSRFLIIKNWEMSPCCQTREKNGEDLTLLLCVPSCPQVPYPVKNNIDINY